MLLNFEPISLDGQAEYLKYFEGCPQKTSDYSFINLWGWAEEYGLSWAWTEKLVWIKQMRPAVQYWAPVGFWDMVDWNRRLMEFPGMSSTFIRVPENLLALWEKNIDRPLSVQEAREHWDYIYDLNELVELKGNRFHKKKNLLVQFTKKIEFQFSPLNTDIIGKALAMQQSWCTWRDCESVEALAAENRVIARVLNDWEKLDGIHGGAILTDDKLIAYTVAEGLDDDTLLIHFEKGDSEYKGVYQAINQLFLEHGKWDYKRVNREQDLGDEGLRKAKMSYHPLEFNKKYRIGL
ncbi:MAG: phosphatidylglycerol lysyltransferase domain-containing protein [Desulfobacterales bacterium]